MQTQKKQLIKGRERIKPLRSMLQFIRFGMVGLSNTLICYITYAILVRMGVHYLYSNAIGFLISVLNAFYWNNKYVFRQAGKRVWWKALLKSLASYSVSSLLLASILLYIWVDFLYVSPYMGQALNLIITIPLNFILNKFWAFK